MIRSNQSLEECIRVVTRTGSSWGGSVDGYCDRFWPVSMWLLWLLWSLRSLRKKIQTIAEIVVAGITGEWFHMIAMIAAIAEVFFFSAIAAITAMVAIIWKPGINLIMAYLKCKDCLQWNLYLNCVSFSEKPLKASHIVWSVSISAAV